MAARAGGHLHRRPGKLLEGLAGGLIAHAEAAALAPAGGEIDSDPPSEAEHVWLWFCDLAGSRKSNGFGGLEPIDHQEIQAWAANMRTEPTPWEVSVLRRMDTATRIILSQKKGGETVSGSVEDASDPEAVKAMFRAMGAKAA